VNDPGVTADGLGAEPRPADDVVAEITAAGGTAVAEYSSVADPEAGEAIVGKALDTYGRIDILINNAGILRDKSFHNLEWENLDAVLDVHLKGAFYVTRPAFRAMREQGYGRVVLTSSNAGLIGNFGQSNYGAAKMGLVGLMHVLRIEGAKYDIKVNTLAPVARTRLTEELFGPLVEKFDPIHVAPVVAYFCSEECAVSGEVWSVAGGNIGRFFVGRTGGYTKRPDQEGLLTPEDVAAHVDEIRDEAGYAVLDTLQDELKLILPKLM
jgi:NAD(P)-dependent dehydrogenase (short-subunit alcohol dehydrogenase family)